MKSTNRFEKKFLEVYDEFKKMFQFQQKIVWLNLFGILILHILFVYSFFAVFLKARLLTIFWGLFVGTFSGIGVTAGAHRLWTHRTYKAKLPLRIFLMCCFMISGEYSIIQWARDHRLHHKHSDTDADPHNASRGFFFSHCGWLMMKRHPEVKEKGKQIDLSDIWADPVIVFHQKYFKPLLVFFFIIFPSAVPLLWWKETWKTSILGIFFFRYAIQLNLTWMVNSFAHFYGTKPYNKSIRAVQNKYVAFFGQGEGWHNYHHVFPWDYKIGEYGQEWQLTARFIELCALLGLAYDLKAAHPDMVCKIIAKANKGVIFEAPDPENTKDKDIQL